jgi:hypothetical protein
MDWPALWYSWRHWRSRHINSQASGINLIPRGLFYFVCRAPYQKMVLL